MIEPPNPEHPASPTPLQPGGFDPDAALEQLETSSGWPRTLLLAVLIAIGFYLGVAALALLVGVYFGICCHFNVLAPGAEWLLDPWLLFGLALLCEVAVAVHQRRQPRQALRLCVLLCFFVVLPILVFVQVRTL